jgi:hypothetical protein
MTVIAMKSAAGTHNVVIDLSNGYAGTVLPRPFRLNGNRLVIGGGKIRIRVLEGVKR